MNFEYPVIKLSEIPQKLLDVIYPLIIGGIADIDVYLCIMVGRTYIQFLSMPQINIKKDFEITLDEFTNLIKYSAISHNITVQYVEKLIEDYNNSIKENYE